MLLISFFLCKSVVQMGGKLIWKVSKHHSVSQIYFFSLIVHCCCFPSNTMKQDFLILLVVYHPQKHISSSLHNTQLDVMHCLFSISKTVSFIKFSQYSGKISSRLLWRQSSTNIKLLWYIQLHTFLGMAEDS